MAIRKNRPVNPNIADGSHKSCSKCDHIYPIAHYGKSHTGRRLLRCQTCTQKATTKAKDTIIIEDAPTEFDITAIKNALVLNNGQKTGTTIGIFGQSKYSGKTTLLKKIIDTCRDEFDYIVLFTTNTEATIYDDLKKMINFKICHKFDPKIVNLFHKINTDTEKNKRLNVLFVLDDEIDNKNNSTLRNMILTYRNMNISTIICSQAYSIVNKQSRGNFNFIFLGKFITGEAMRDLINIYMDFSAFPALEGATKPVKEKALLNYYKEHTADYNFIVINSNDDKTKYNKYRVN
jgi:hypothetical protein